MTLAGKWRNQYGSILEITHDADHRIEGHFRTALEDSGFFGQQIPVVGFRQGNCVGLAGGGTATAGDAIVTYTGLLRDGRLETLWYVVADAALSAAKEGEPAKVKQVNWWRAITTSADTFERVP